MSDKMEIDGEMLTFQQQALEIRQPDADFDPTVVPQNGEEFLMHMLYERKHCPAVVVNRPPHLEYDDLERTITASEITLNNSLSNLLPTKEWKAMQSEDFLSTRHAINHMRELLAKCKYDQELEPPLTKDPTEWQLFCRQNQPLLRTVLRLSQGSLEKLLDMLKEWMNIANEISLGDLVNPSSTSSPPSAPAAAATENVDADIGSHTLDLADSGKWLGYWLYATLICLHLPLEPRVHSTLRDIARICINQRNRLMSQEQEKAVPYNLFIHLISSVFGQLDFAECV